MKTSFIFVILILLFYIQLSSLQNNFNFKNNIRCYVGHCKSYGSINIGELVAKKNKFSFYLNLDFGKLILCMHN